MYPNPNPRKCCSHTGLSQLAVLETSQYNTARPQTKHYPYFFLYHYCTFRPEPREVSKLELTFTASNCSKNDCAITSIRKKQSNFSV